MSVNKAILLGRLGKDPELKYTSSGKAVCTFSIATSFKYTSGEEATTWHNIVAWEKKAETIKEYLTKGQEVFIEGRIQNRSYDDNDGNKKYISEVIVSSISFVGRNIQQTDGQVDKQTGEVKGNNDDDAPKKDNKIKGMGSKDDSDLPF